LLDTGNGDLLELCAHVLENRLFFLILIGESGKEPVLLTFKLSFEFGHGFYFFFSQLALKELHVAEKVRVRG